MEFRRASLRRFRTPAGLIGLLLLLGACSQTSSYVRGADSSTVDTVSVPRASDTPSTASPPSEATSTTSATDTTLPATTSTATVTTAPSTTAAPTTAASTTTAPPTTAPLPADLPPNEASMSDPAVAENVLSKLGPILGDPDGKQLMEFPALRANLQRVLDGQITTSEFFSFRNLPASVVPEGITIAWLMCSDSVGPDCGGSVGNFVYEMRFCNDTPARRWSTEYIADGDRFAAAGYCEYEPSKTQFDAASANIARCMETYLQQNGLTAVREPGYDTAAQSITRYFFDDLPSIESDVAKAGANAARWVWVTTENLEANQANQAGCLHNIQSEFAALPAPRPLNGHYGVAVTGRDRQVNAVIVVG